MIKPGFRVCDKHNFEKKGVVLGKLEAPNAYGRPTRIEDENSYVPVEWDTDDQTWENIDDLIVLDDEMSDLNMENKKISLGRLRKIIQEEIYRSRNSTIKIGPMQLRALISEMVGDDEEPEDISSKTAGDDREQSLFSMLSPNEKKQRIANRKNKVERLPSKVPHFSKSKQMDVEDRQAQKAARAARLQKLKDRNALRKNGQELDKLRDPGMQSAAYRRRLRKQNNENASVDEARERYSPIKKATKMPEPGTGTRAVIDRWIAQNGEIYAHEAADAYNSVNSYGQSLDTTKRYYSPSVSLILNKYGSKDKTQLGKHSPWLLDPQWMAYTS